MNIRIDGKNIEVTDIGKNIVEICDDNGIALSAPCFRKNEKQDHCKGCAVEINGEIKYACQTKPQENMDIKIDTPALLQLRKQNIKTYIENVFKTQGCCVSTAGSRVCSRNSE